MEYLIGFYSRSFPIYDLLDSKIKEGMSLKKEGNFVAVDSLYGANPVCESLTDIICDTIKVNVITKEVMLSYYFVDEYMRTCILKETLTALCDKELSAYTRSEVFTIIKDCLEKSSLLCVDGLLRFRLSEVIKSWLEVLDDIAYNMMLNEEHEEFLNILRYVVDNKIPGENEVVVRFHNGEYEIFKNDGQQLEVEIYTPPELTPEDILLSKLVSIATREITLDIRNKELCCVINSIFSNVHIL